MTYIYASKPVYEAYNAFMADQKIAAIGLKPSTAPPLFRAWARNEPYTQGWTRG